MDGARVHGIPGNPTAELLEELEGVQQPQMELTGASCGLSVPGTITAELLQHR